MLYLHIKALFLESELKFRVLKNFLAVAREETISGAAGVLHVTQPALSRQMMELEDELGVSLFLRGKRKITLTEEGKLLRKRAQEILDLVGKTRAELAASSGVVSGGVYIGGGETHAMQMVADIIRDLQAAHPHLCFHFYSGNEEEVTERLDKGLLDFGILIEPSDLSKYDSLRLPAVDVWGVYMRRDSPLAAFESICAEQLWEAPLILSRQMLASREITGWFKRDPAALNVVNTYNLAYNPSLLVQAGAGYMVSIGKLLNLTSESDLCFRPLKPAIVSHIDVVWKKYQVFSRAAALFLERLRQGKS